MLLGHTCVCAVEIEPYCRRALTQCRETWHHVVKSQSPRDAFLQLLKENPIVAGSRSPIHLFVRSGDIEFHLSAKSLQDAAKRSEDVHLHVIKPKRMKKPDEYLLYWPFDNFGESRLTTEQTATNLPQSKTD